MCLKIYESNSASVCSGATSWKVVGSVPDGVAGIFHLHNPSGHTLALGLTQLLTEMSTRNNSSGVKAAGVYGWQPNHLHVMIVLKSGNLNLLESSVPVQACNGIALPLPLPFNSGSNNNFHSPEMCWINCGFSVLIPVAFSLSTLQFYHKILYIWKTYVLQ
jgi:hypothetical protein